MLDGKLTSSKLNLIGWTALITLLFSSYAVPVEAKLLKLQSPTSDLYAGGTFAKMNAIRFGPGNQGVEINYSLPTGNFKIAFFLVTLAEENSANASSTRFIQPLNNSQNGYARIHP